MEGLKVWSFTRYLIEGVHNEVKAQSQTEQVWPFSWYLIHKACNEENRHRSKIERVQPVVQTGFDIREHYINMCNKSGPITAHIKQYAPNQPLILFNVPEQQPRKHIVLCFRARIFGCREMMSEFIWMRGPRAIFVWRSGFLLGQVYTMVRTAFHKFNLNLGHSPRVPNPQRVSERFALCNRNPIFVARINP